MRDFLAYWIALNKGYWGRNLRIMLHSFLAFSLIIVTLTFLVGFYNFYANISQRLSHATVVSVSGLENLIIDDPGPLDPSGVLIITARGKWILDASFQAFTDFALVISGYTFVKELWGSASTTAFELESKLEDYHWFINAAKDTRLVYRLAVFQKLVVSLVPLALATLVTKWILLPVVYGRIDPAFRVVFTFDLTNVWLVYFLPVVITVNGLVMAQIYANRMIKRFERQ